MIMARYIYFSSMLKACVQLSRRKQFKEKLAFSFCHKSRLDKDLATLRSLNQDFRGIGDKFFKLEYVRTIQTPRTARRQDKEVEKRRLIQKASFFSIKHLDQHVQNIQNTRPILSPAQPQVRFSIAFSNLTLGNNTGLGDLLWFDVDTSIKEALTADAAQICNALAQVSSSLKRRNLSPFPSPPPATKLQKRGKTARPVPSTPPPGSLLLPPVTQLLSVALEPPNLYKHGNFCNQLKDCSHASRWSGKIVLSAFSRKRESTDTLFIFLRSHQSPSKRELYH